ncbi:MAG: DUF5681 domain-containing protein [Promethearchaeota archaeon]
MGTNTSGIKPHEFKKGQSGNPKGKPKGRLNMTTILKKYLNERTTIKKGDKRIRLSKAQALMLKWIELGLTGELKAIKDVVERIDGKPLERQEIEQLNKNLDVPIDFSKLNDLSEDELDRLDNILTKLSPSSKKD